MTYYMPMSYNQVYTQYPMQPMYQANLQYPFNYGHNYVQPKQPVQTTNIVKQSEPHSQKLSLNVIKKEYFISLGIIDKKQKNNQTPNGSLCNEIIFNNYGECFLFGQTHNKK